MFDLAVEQLGVDKKDVLAVGDSMETDIKGAAAAGLTPVLVDRRERREYERKVKTLKDIIPIVEGSA